jgi:hypothetical protein
LSIAVPLFFIDVFGLTTKTKGEKMDPIEQMIADAPDELKNRLYCSSQ